MKLSDDELRWIVGQSSTLRERLGGNFESASQNHESLSSLELAKKWRTVLAGDDNNDRLVKRLMWDGIDTADALARLGSVRPRLDQPLPDWADMLNEVLTAAATGGRPETCDFLDAERPVPFQQILVPFVEVADNLLRQRTPMPASELLCQSARANLKRGLLSQLALVSFSTLDAEFSAYRVARRQVAFTSAIELLSNENSNKFYSSFSHELANGGLKKLFVEYAVLSRLMIETIHRWIDASCEFIQHLLDDREQLEHVFGIDRLGAVRNLEASLSDAHNGGRTVIRTSFESGLELIYKPRDIRVEQAYFSFLNWLNQTNSTLKLRTLKVIERGDHGWVEYCPASSCNEPSAISRFYKRSGMLLCVVYALRGTDFHSENIIACDDQPMLVDLETLLNPEAGSKPQHTQNANQNATRRLKESVINTHLLPQWHKGGGSDAISDRSGIGAIDSQMVEYRRLKYVNTDRMAVLNTIAPLSDGHNNSPFSPQSSTSLGDHVEDVVSGFSEMYRVLLEHRNQLLDVGSPLQEFMGVRLRLVLRPTALYFSLLVRSLGPEAMCDGIERSLHLEALCRAFLGQRERPDAWPLVSEEQLSLEQLDIPSFEFLSDSLAVGTRRESNLCKVFEESGYEAMIKRLLLFEEKDLMQQVEYIRGSLYSRLFLDPLASPAIVPLQTNIRTQLLSATELLGRAESIGREIADRSIKGDDGSTTWISVNYEFDIDRHQFSTMGPGLYAGVSGVSLFLAALEKLKQNGEYGPAAMAPLKSWRHFFEKADDRSRETLINQVGIGIGGGLAGLIFSYVAVSKLLNQAKLVQDAERVARFITSRRIEADRDFDILGGSAGVILALLKLYASTKNSEHLTKAVWCGQHLLHYRRPSASGPRAWVNMGNTLPLTGFSHGAAGIAYALLRLFEVTREAKYLEAARESIDYERTAFSAESSNWFDLRQASASADEPSCMVSWCHGAPGIGLARAAGLRILDDVRIREEIDIALLTTERFSLQDVDHLCCGNFGRVEFLLLASRALCRPELYETALNRTGRIIQRAGNLDEFRLLPNFPGKHFNPGLFQGSAGIGYELLRLIDSEAIPSILVFE